MTRIASTHLPDWDVPQEEAPRNAAMLLAVGLMVAAAAALYLVAGLPGAVTLVAIVVAVYWWARRTHGTTALRQAGAVPAAATSVPRLANLVTGLSADIGAPVPRLWVIPSGGPNAMIAWSRGPHLAVSQTLLDTYALTELEAVVAHCLVRHVSGDARRQAATSLIVPSGSGARVGTAMDGRAAALTRYPPALAAAIRKAEPYKGRGAESWFVAEGPSHVPAPERAAALDDL